MRAERTPENEGQAAAISWSACELHCGVSPQVDSGCMDIRCELCCVLVKETSASAASIDSWPEADEAGVRKGYGAARECGLGEEGYGA
jgi:hypothetical protein